MANGPERDELLAHSIIKAATLVKRKIGSAFHAKGYDLTFDQWVILMVLLSQPGMIQSDLAERTLKDKTNVTRILDLLEKSGYLERRAHECDRRSTRLYLTDSCVKMLGEPTALSREINLKCREGISDEELDVFYSVLERIGKNAEAITTSKSKME